MITNSLTSEEFLLSKLVSISLDKEYPGNIVIKDLEEFVVMYNRKNRYLDVDYINIWSVFEKQYNMNYTDIQLFITNMMLKHLNWRPETPQCIMQPKPMKDVEAPQLEARNTNNRIEVFGLTDVEAPQLEARNTSPEYMELCKKDVEAPQLET